MPVNFNPRPPLAPIRRDTRFALPPSLGPTAMPTQDIDPAIARALSELPPPETDMPLPPPPPPGPNVRMEPDGSRWIYQEPTEILDEQGQVQQYGGGWQQLSGPTAPRTSPYETANAQFDLAQRMRGLEAMVDTPFGKMTAQEAAAMRNYNLPPPPTLAEQTTANVEQERQLRGEGLGSYYQGPPTEYQQGLLREQGLSREQTTANQARQAELEQWRQQGWRPGTPQEVAAYYVSLDKLRRFYGGG